MAAGPLRRQALDPVDQPGKDVGHTYAMPLAAAGMKIDFKGPTIGTVRCRM
ncbi:MAG: hypothetical protein WAM92_11930 [Mycobacterium sp.]